MDSQIREEAIRQRVYTSDLTFRRLVKKLQALTNLVDSVTGENNQWAVKNNEGPKEENNDNSQGEPPLPLPRIESHKTQIESARDSLLVDLAIFDSGLVKLAAMHRVYQIETKNYISMQHNFPSEKQKAEQLGLNLETVLARSEKLQRYRQEYNELIIQIKTGGNSTKHSRSSSLSSQTLKSTTSGLPHAVSELSRMIDVLEKENTHLERENKLLYESVESRQKWADEIVISLDKVKQQINNDNDERIRLQSSQEQDEEDNEQQQQQQQQQNEETENSPTESSQATSPPPQREAQDEIKENKQRNNNDNDSDMPDVNV